VKLYLDTSALVKLYVEESGSQTVRRWLDEADIVATSIVAYVEARSAFARRRRERKILGSAYAAITRDFEVDWNRYVIIEITDSLIRRAGRLTDIYALRGYDAIHLASAQLFKEKLTDHASFATWDERLALAAHKVGFSVLPSMESRAKR
jgi:predicted nucleic acid-binding protein